MNHPELWDDAVLEGDVRELEMVGKLRQALNDRRLDLLVGGPPCQGFSMMGNRIPHKFENGDKKFGADYNFAEDERNHLFEAMINIARELTPRYVVIENVPGLGSAEIEEKSYAEHIAVNLESYDYQTEVIRLEAANFGIPQNRHRYFILGTYQGERTPKLDELMQVNETTALKHALYDLPELSVSDGTWIAPHTDEPNQNAELYNQYLGRFNIRGDTHILFNHVTRFNNEDDIELYSNLGQGETYRQLVERLTTEFGEKPLFAKCRIENFEDKYYRMQWNEHNGRLHYYALPDHLKTHKNQTSFTDRFKVVAANLPVSHTVVAHIAKDGHYYIHPDIEQNRSLTSREAARLQTFPDDYFNQLPFVV